MKKKFTIKISSKKAGSTYEIFLRDYLTGYFKKSTKKACSFRVASKAK